MTRPHPLRLVGNPDGTRKITQTITPSRLGYYCRTIHGIGIVGEAPLFSFTRRGIERKADRLARKLHRDDLRHLEAEHRIWTPTGIPTTDLRGEGGTDASKATSSTSTLAVDVSLPGVDKAD